MAERELSRLKRPSRLIRRPKLEEDLVGNVSLLSVVGSWWKVCGKLGISFGLPGFRRARLAVIYIAALEVSCLQFTRLCDLSLLVSPIYARGIHHAPEAQTFVPR